MVISGPGIAKGEVSDAKVGLHDLCQTVLELTGLESFNTSDSQSFIKVLRNPKENDKYFKKGFAEYFGGRILLTQRIIWDGPWKLVFNGFDFDELYNLEEDPNEMRNLIDDMEYQGKIKEMYKEMWKVIRDTNDHSLLNAQYPILRVGMFGPGIIDE